MTSTKTLFIILIFFLTIEFVTSFIYSHQILSQNSLYHQQQEFISRLSLQVEDLEIKYSQLTSLNHLVQTSEFIKLTPILKTINLDLDYAQN